VAVGFDLLGFGGELFGFGGREGGLEKKFWHGGGSEWIGMAARIGVMNGVLGWMRVVGLRIQVGVTRDKQLWRNP
jgi:hypothetical protein